MTFRYSTGGDFTYPGNDIRPNYYLYRGTQVLESVLANPDSFGFVASDRVNEDGFEGKIEVLEPVSNEMGQLLRFGLVAKRRRTLKRQLDVVTSYPETCKRLFGMLGLQLGQLRYEPGCVEAKVNELDWSGFELIQSGDSVRENDLVILEDNIEQVNLLRVSGSLSSENK